MAGIVTKIDKVKGFGFIRPEGAPKDGSQDRFFHRSAAGVFGELNEGDSVSFTPIAGRDNSKGNGLAAAGVTRA